MSENNSLPAPAGNNYAAHEGAKSSATACPDPMEVASQDDARWFSQNPRRSHRIRPPVPGEFGIREPHTPKPLTRWVIVRQVKPGFRMRMSFAICGTPAFTETAGKAICDRLLGIGGAGIFSGRPGHA